MAASHAKITSASLTNSACRTPLVFAGYRAVKCDISDVVMRGFSRTPLVFEIPNALKAAKHLRSSAKPGRFVGLSTNLVVLPMLIAWLHGSSDHFLLR